MTSEADSESGSRGPNVRFIIESALMIALITGAAILLETVFFRKPIDRLEKTFDDISVAYFTLRVDQPHPKVAVVAIDDPTIEQLPWRSPVSRTFLADLLEILDKGGPAGIGIDVTFFEPSYDPSDDERLARVLSNMKTPVVLATGLKGNERRPLAEIFEKIENPLVKTALANFPVDRDDRTLRDFRPAFEDKNGELHDTMAVVLARQAGAEVPRTTKDIPIAWYGQPGLQDQELPGGGYAGERPIAIYSALTLLKVPAIAITPMVTQLLKDKVVLVGATFEGSHDFLRTPFDLRTLKDESFAGVFGHAQVVAQLLDGRSRPKVGRVVGSLLVLMAAIVGMLVALLRVPAVIPLILAVALPIAWILGVFLVRREFGIGLPYVPPALAAGLSLATFALFRARRFDAASRVAAKALNSYLPPALARRVMNDPGLLRLGGEPRELSILFTDIAGFTSYSERSKPDEVVRVLNSYLDAMAEIVLDHDGTLDKFIGDAVMAFFGAPVADPAHSERAISCALNMDRFAREFEKEHGLKTRIGVHTGGVIVGNVGGERRFDYTVIGDAVNTAARLEGVNKFLGPDKDRITTVCISDDTVMHYRRVAPELENAADRLIINLTAEEMAAHPESPTLRRVGKVQVKGRENPLDVYTNTPPGYTPENLETYVTALELLEAGRHEEAGKKFKELYNDDLSAYQRLRCVNREGPTLTLTEK